MVGQNFKNSRELTAAYEQGRALTALDWSWFNERAFWVGKQLVVETVVFDADGTLMYVEVQVSVMVVHNIACPSTILFLPPPPHSSRRDLEEPFTPEEEAMLQGMHLPTCFGRNDGANRKVGACWGNAYGGCMVDQCGIPPMCAMRIALRMITLITPSL